MNYDTMKAGREMDALVAKLMDWMYFHKIHYCEDSWYEWCEYCHGGNENSGKPLNRSGDDEKVAGECDTPPPYSTSISAAWEVVEKIHSLGWCLDLSDMRHSPEDPGWWWELNRYDPLDDPAFPELEGHPVCTHYYKLDGGAPTAPLAICRAALKATT